MLKNNLSLQVILIAISLSMPNYVHAYNCHDYSFYLGLGLQRTFFDAQRSEPKFVFIGNQQVSAIPAMIQPQQYHNFMDGKAIVAGINLRNVGVEFGYNPYNTIYYPTLFFNPPYGTPTTGKQTGYNLYVDAILYYQFCRNFVVKFRFGSGFLSTRYQLITNTTFGGGDVPLIQDQVKIDFWGNSIRARCGIGLQWNFARSWSTEFFYVYQNGNQLLKNLQSINIGLNYYIFSF